ncbi:MAG: DUF6331 family protein [Chloroflexota bacterium]
MNRRTHKDDILIGPNNWITFISLEGRHSDAVCVDYYLEEVWPFLAKLETLCVAGCCGFDAFDFTTDAVIEALKDEDPGILGHAFDQVINHDTRIGIICHSKY